MRLRSATLATHPLVWIALAGTALASVATADPAPAPSAFAYMPTYGVGLFPTGFISGQMGYQFTLSSGAYIDFGGTHYPIALVWGIYAVNKTGSAASDFTATGPNTGEWTWDQKPNSGNTLSVGGWLDAPKGQALAAPASGSVSKLFTYSQFSFTGTQPLLGIHVTVTVPDGESSPFGEGLTGDIIPTAVPEPASATVLLCGAFALGFRRRR